MAPSPHNTTTIPPIPITQDIATRQAPTPTTVDTVTAMVIMDMVKKLHQQHLQNMIHMTLIQDTTIHMVVTLMIRNGIQLPQLLLQALSPLVLPWPLPKPFDYFRLESHR